MRSLPFLHGQAQAHTRKSLLREGLPCAPDVTTPGTALEGVTQARFHTWEARGGF